MSFRFLMYFTAFMMGSVAFAQSAEELVGRANAVERSNERARERSWKQDLADAERRFQANHGRSYLSEAEVQKLSERLGISIGSAYVQAPRVSKNRWDWDSRTKKQSVTITDAGVFCKGGDYYPSMNCYYNDGRFFKSYEFDPLGRD